MKKRTKKQEKELSEILKEIEAMRQRCICGGDAVSSKSLPTKKIKDLPDWGWSD